jgi:hypothetical protein
VTCVFLYVAMVIAVAGVPANLFLKPTRETP